MNKMAKKDDSTRLKRECVTCFKEFSVYKSHLINSNISGKFCSRPCYNLDLRKRVGSLNQSYRRINLKCDTCNKNIQVIPTNVRIHKNHFCSMTCSSRFHTGRFVKEKNPTWKGGNLKRGDFYPIRDKYFKYPQFCALCGEIRNVHIHHIIPYRFTKDNSLSNLIPLCAKHHMSIEIMTYKLLETVPPSNLTKFVLNNILRSSQLATWSLIKSIQSRI